MKAMLRMYVWAVAALLAVPVLATDLNVDGKLKVLNPTVTTNTFSVAGTGWFENATSAAALKIFAGSSLAGGANVIESSIGTSGSYLPIILTANSGSYTQQLVVETDGQVGIGGTAAARLQVNGAANSDGIIVNAPQTPGFRFLATAPQSTDRNWAMFTNYEDHGDFVLARSTTSTASPYGGTVVMKLQSNNDASFAGNVYFAGNVEAGLQIKAKFQDIAEWVPATEPIPAGTVVVVAARNHVSPSTSAYDTGVAGVVSPQPGLILGEEGASKVLVATTGRVRVRVDASNGAIREGDLLVSSGVKGTAMKSAPLVLEGRKFHQPGTVIGKALEPLESGTGEILVLLSMQ